MKSIQCLVHSKQDLNISYCYLLSVSNSTEAKYSMKGLLIICVRKIIYSMSTFKDNICIR